MSETRQAIAERIVNAVRTDGDPAFAHLLTEYDAALAHQVREQAALPVASEALADLQCAAIYATKYEGLCADVDDRGKWVLYREHEAAIAELRAEVERWRGLASDAAHAMEGARIWGGMEWTYNPLHPFRYLPALKALRAALDDANAARAGASGV